MVLVREHMGICDECSKRRNLMGVVELIHHTPAMRRIAQIAKETLP
jgi:hypothetical protein